MNQNSRIPLYLQLMEHIIHGIDDGTYPEHQKLPSERALCDLHQLSRITVRQALQELEREGYIYKSHGKGTFVSPQTYSQNLIKLYSFTDEMKHQGLTAETSVLSFDVIVAGNRLAERMNLNQSDEVFQIVRLRLADREPLMLETSYVPKHMFPDLSAGQMSAQPMYDIFRDDYRIVVTSAEEQFSATTVDKHEAQKLNLSDHDPAMLIKRMAYFHNTLIEYTVSVARGDKFNYRVELT